MWNAIISLFSITVGLYQGDFREIQPDPMLLTMIYLFLLVSVVLLLNLLIAQLNQTYEYINKERYCQLATLFFLCFHTQYTVPYHREDWLRQTLPSKEWEESKLWCKYTGCFGKQVGHSLPGSVPNSLALRGEAWYCFEDVIGFARLNRASLVVDAMASCPKAKWKSFVAVSWPHSMHSTWSV